MYGTKAISTVAIICIYFFYPTFASDQVSLGEAYRVRLAQGQQEIDALQQDMISSLQANENVIATAKQKIAEKRSRLEAPLLFLHELDVVLEGVLPAEQLISDQQRKELIVSPTQENLQPIKTTKSKIQVFYRKWQALAAYVESVQLYARQTLWYQREWDAFVQQSQSISKDQPMSCEYFKKAYELIVYFQRRPIELLRAHDYFKDEVASADAFLANFKFIPHTVKLLMDFFQKRGSVLWQLITSFFDDPSINLSYQDLEPDFFMDQQNPVKVLLLSQDTQAKLPAQPDQATEVLKKLPEEFKLPEGWEKVIQDYQTQARLLIHAKFISNPLQAIVQHYENFEETYLENLTEARDIFTPKVNLIMPEQSLTIHQSMARRACCLDSNGPLCFGRPQEGTAGSGKVAYLATPASFENTVETIKLTQRAGGFTARVGEQHARYWLERLFNISSTPTVFIAFDNIYFYSQPENARHIVASGQLANIDENIYKRFLRHPEDWITVTRAHFAAAQANPLEESLEKFLGKVVSLQAHFDQLDSRSYGLQTLFSILTSSSASPDNFVLREKEGIYELVRTGHDSFLQPSFEFTRDSKHSLIERNILYLFPSVGMPIPDSVRKAFSSNDILFILAYWLAKLRESQGYFDTIIETYNLKQPDKKIDSMSEAQAWGLMIEMRPGTISQLIEDFFCMKSLLGSSGITYLDVLKAIRPGVFNCYSDLLDRTREKTRKKETKIFFKLVPIYIDQLRRIYAQLKVLGEPVFDYSEEELRQFEEIAKAALESKTASIEDLPSTLPQKVRSFFEEKYRWMVQKGIFAAETLFKAWEALVDIDNPILYEELQLPYRISAHIPSLDKTLPATREGQDFGSAQFFPAIEQELVENCNLLPKPLDEAIEILTLLTRQVPNPETFHNSWNAIVSWSQGEYLAAPSSLLAFFRNHGLQTNTEREVLQDTQMTTYKYYAGHIDTIENSYLLIAQQHPEKLASYLLRQLWLGPLNKLQAKDRLFFDAVLDLLILPEDSAKEADIEIERELGSLGFASNPLSKEGPIERRIAVGDHYLLARNTKWVEMWASSQTLSAEMRKAMLSHPLPLLHLQWLSTLNNLKANIQFHPWFIKTLIDKSIELENLLKIYLHPTFQDVMLVLWPEFHLWYHKKFETYKTTEHVRKKIQEETEGKAPYEVKDMDLDTVVKDNKNLLTVFEEWDQYREEYAMSPPLSLKDAASEVFTNVNPHDYGQEVLVRILNLAAGFPIDVRDIKHGHWKNLDLFRALMQRSLAPKTAQLTIALQLGCAAEDVEITEASLKVSGNKRGLAPLLEVLSFFSHLTTLDLSYNRLHSLQPLLDYLKSLKTLRTLVLKGNPLHNPTPLLELLQLEELDISETSIPDVRFLRTPKGEKTLPNLKVLKANKTEMIDQQYGLFAPGFAALEEQSRNVMALMEAEPDYVWQARQQVAQWLESNRLTDEERAALRALNILQDPEKLFLKDSWKSWNNQVELETYREAKKRLKRATGLEDQKFLPLKATLQKVLDLYEKTERELPGGPDKLLMPRVSLFGDWTGPPLRVGHETFADAVGFKLTHYGVYNGTRKATVKGSHVVFQKNNVHFKQAVGRGGPIYAGPALAVFFLHCLMEGNPQGVTPIVYLYATNIAKATTVTEPTYESLTFQGSRSVNGETLEEYMKAGKDISLLDFKSYLFIQFRALLLGANDMRPPNLMVTSYNTLIDIDYDWLSVCMKKELKDVLMTIQAFDVLKLRSILLLFDSHMKRNIPKDLRIFSHLPVTAIPCKQDRTPALLKNAFADPVTMKLALQWLAVLSIQDQVFHTMARETQTQDFPWQLEFDPGIFAWFLNNIHSLRTIFMEFEDKPLTLNHIFERLYPIPRAHYKKMSLEGSIAGKSLLEIFQEIYSWQRQDRSLTTTEIVLGDHVFPDGQTYERKIADWYETNRTLFGWEQPYRTKGKDTLPVQGMIRLLVDHLPLVAYLAHLNQAPHLPDTVLSVIERLAENFWDETLGSDNKDLRDASLFEFLKTLDPRETTYRLAFALKFSLPQGTVRDSLSFQGDLITDQPSCLTQLNITGVPLRSNFLSSLSQFTCLQKLFATNLDLEGLDDFPRMPTLQLLDLSNNKIKSLRGLRDKQANRKFPNLNVLILVNNFLQTTESVNLLIELTHLSYLDLSFNQLSVTPSLGSLRLLRFLDLRNNFIRPQGLQNSGKFFYTPQRKM